MPITKISTLLLLSTLLLVGRGLDSTQFTRRRSRGNNRASPPQLADLKNKTTHLGKKVTLKCRAFSATAPHFQWIRSFPDKSLQVIISNKPRITITTHENDGSSLFVSRLVIQPVSLEDQGRYNCHAGNAFGINTRSLWLEVRREDMPSRPVLDNPENKTVTSGENVTLECKSFTKNVHLHWMKPTHNSSFPKAITVSSRIDIQYEPNGKDGLISRLEIRSVTLEDQGIYTCLAANIVGYRSINIWLNIRADANNVSYTATTSELTTVARITPFLEEEHNVSVNDFMRRLLERVERLPPTKKREFRERVGSLLEELEDDRP